MTLHEAQQGAGPGFTGYAAIVLLGLGAAGIGAFHALNRLNRYLRYGITNKA